MMQTDRILLRPWQESDAEALYRYASDPDVGLRAGWPPHKSVEESLDVIRNIFLNDTNWAIVLRATGELIGAMGYMPQCGLNLPAREGEPMVGYWVGKPYWNQGICTEALQLMIAHIRRNTNYTSLISSHYVDNPASGRVMEKCGFRATGETAIDDTLEPGVPHLMRVLRLELKSTASATIRLETPQDYREVENLTREAFWNVYAPGCVEHYVLNQYRNNPDFIPGLDFVMEVDDRIIGHVMFSKAEIHRPDGTIIPAWTFGPISIHPDYKRQGYGLKLLNYAIGKAREMGVGVLCMEGNIEFYKHAGFVVASTLGIHYHAEPEDAAVPYFLAQELIPGYLSTVVGTADTATDVLRGSDGTDPQTSTSCRRSVGTYHTPKGYYVAFENKDAFEAYEATFPPKEKQAQDGQLRSE